MEIHKTTLALNNMLQAFIAEQEQPEKLFRSLLAELLNYTQSQYGFIAEVAVSAEKTSFLKMKAISNIAWDDHTRNLYESYGPHGEGMEFFTLDNLFGEVVKTQAAVISNAPSSDQRSGGLPKGHPPLTSFLGIPIIFKDTLLGMYGLANRKNGYDANWPEKLMPFTSCCSVMLFHLNKKNELEDAVQQKQELLNDVGRLAAVGGWEVSLHDSNLQWTAETYRIHGLDQNNPLDMANAINCYPGQAAATIFEAVKELIENGTPYDLELPLVNFKGQHLWVRTQGRREVKNNVAVRIFGTFQDITQQKKVQQELKEFEQLFLLSNSPMCLVSFDGYLKKVNPSWINVLGYSEEELYKRPFIEYVHPDDIARTIEEYQALLAKKSTSFYFQNRYRCKDGSYRWFSWSTVVDYTSQQLYCSVHDITWLKESERLLSESEERYRVLVDLSPMAVVVHVEGKVVYANNACKKLVKESAHKPFIGMLVADLIHPDYRDIVSKRVSDLSQKGGIVPLLEQKIVCLDGSIVEAEIVAATISFNNKNAVLAIINDISDRKKAENTIKDSRVSLSLAHKLAKLGHWELNLTTLELALSTEHLAMMGIKEADMVQSVFLLGDYAQQYVYAADQKIIEERLMYAIKHHDSRYSDSFEYRLHHLDGTIHYLAVQTIFNKEGSIRGVSQDITARKLTELELEKSTTNLEAVLTNTHDAICALDQYLGIVFMNRSFEQSYLLGFGQAPAIGSSFLSTLPPTHRAEWENALDRTMAGEFIRFEKKIGAHLHLEYSLNPIWRDGNIMGISLFGRDITQQKEHADALKAQNQELIKINQELDNFVYRVSHDLRAPLTSSLGLLNLIGSLEPPQEINKYLGLQHDSLKKMDGFIRDILDYSRNSRTELSQDEVSFEKLISGLLAQHEFTAGGKAVTVTQHIEQSAPFISDAMRLQIVLSNLISNAFRYYNPYIENPWLSIEVKVTEVEAVIQLSDNGIGIQAEHLPHIFKMFYRATDHKVVGSGLGLYIVKESVEKMGGSITVESKMNKGSVFTVLLPDLKHRG